MSAEIDRLVEGASDFIVTHDLIERGGDWDAAAIDGLRYAVLGVLAYLSEASRRTGCEPELNALLIKVSAERGT